VPELVWTAPGGTREKECCRSASEVKSWKCSDGRDEVAEAGKNTSSCERMDVVRAALTSLAPQSAASPLPSHEPPIPSSLAPPLSLRGAIINEPGVSLKPHPAIA
jgi:hypothetical protein